MHQEAHFPLAPPPRPVPFLLRAQVLFGGVFSIIGWIFFSFGMIFAVVFGSLADLTSWYHFRGPLATAGGTLLEVTETSASENKTRIYAYKYSFRAEGANYEGVSYLPGRQHEPGEQVTLEYVEGNPSLSRIRGMRRAEFGPWVLFVLIFPGLGFIFILVSLRGGLKANRLLRNGKLAWGELVSKEPTSTRINNRTVFKLTFDFQPEEGGHAQAVARSHEPEKLQDEQRERLLYDPFHPETAVLLDALPASPAIDMTGNLQTRNPVFAALTLLLPGIPLATLAGLLYFLYLS
ncbi:MAG: DUF3592 domain-containing protein [Gammaproteobacteria bacterium]